MARTECEKSVIEEEISRILLGEVLTLIDVTGLENKAKEALKSLVKQCFARRVNACLSSLLNLDREVI